MLTAGYNSVSLALFGIAVGILASSVLTLVSVPFTDAKVFAMFVALGVTSAFFTLFFGIAAWREWREGRRELWQGRSV